MGRFVLEIFQKVFHEEENNLVRWLKRRKLTVLIIALLVGALLAYLKWPEEFVALFRLLVNRSDILFQSFLVTWLAIFDFLPFAES